MRYIDTWLSGLGLEYVIPKLKANGITTPKKLATLTLRDIYEVVGVENPEDRKKLFFLIQRLQTILQSKSQGTKPTEAADSDGDAEGEGGAAVAASATTSATAGDGVHATNGNGLHEGGQPKRSATAEGRKASAEKARPKSQVIRPRTSYDPSEPKPQLLRSNSSAACSEPVKRVEAVLQHKQLEEPADLRGSGRLSTSSSLLVGPASPKISPKAIVPASKGAPRAAEPPTLLSPPLQRKYSNIPTSDNQWISPPPPPPTAVADITAPSHAAYKPSPQLHSEGNANGRLQRHHTAPTTASSSLSAAAAAAAASSVASAPAPVPAPAQTPFSDASGFDMPIRVVVRKRPLSKQEISRHERDVMEIRPKGTVLVHEPKVKVDLTKVVETQGFVFDDAFDGFETNETIYSRTIRPLVSFLFEGGKATCFAYGQTGSGKTFSMMGSNPSNPQADSSNPGLYVLAGRDIFSTIARNSLQNIQVDVSCFEIYGGKLFDLLNGRSQIKCLEDAKQQVQLPGLTQHPAHSVEDLLALMAKAHTQRSTGSTGANAESSRSHQILQISLTDTRRAKSAARPPWLGGKFSFIDLAGSERGADTHSSSKQTRMEGAEINTSLLALKEVIRSLEKKHGHTPFRGSKLTQVLKDSFIREKSRTCMMACVSPSHANCEHTLNTLRYADRVKEHSIASADNAVESSPEVAPQPPALPHWSDAQGPPVMDARERVDLASEVAKLRISPEKLGSGAHASSDPHLKALFPSRETAAAAAAVPAAGGGAGGGPATRNRPRSMGGSSHGRKSSSPKAIPTGPDGSRASGFAVEVNHSGTEIIRKTVNLLAAHKLSIAEMVEVMKDEMELVQEMENVDERDTEIYLNKLERILDMKTAAIHALKDELDSFQRFRSL